MVRNCCVPQCDSTTNNFGISFHKFPQDPTLRKIWIHAIKTGKKVNFNTMCVCSKHFEKADFKNGVLPGARPCVRLRQAVTPTVNLPKLSVVYNEPSKKTIEQRESRAQRRLSRNCNKQLAAVNAAKHDAKQDEENNDVSDNAVESICEEPEIQNSDDKLPHNVITEKDEEVEEFTPRQQQLIYQLQQELREQRGEITKKDETITHLRTQLKIKDAQVANLRVQLEVEQQKSRQLGAKNVCLIKDMKKNNEKVFDIENVKDAETLNYYTGVINYEMFTKILQFAVPNLDTNNINYGEGLAPDYLSLENQFLFVLCKLRNNLGFQDLAFRFGKSKSGMSRLFKVWVNFLYMRLGMLDLWPSRENIILSMPPEFKKDFPRVLVILDGTEIYIQRPSSLLLQSQSYSSYKSHNTLKALVGIEPGGGFIFISELFDGSISDKEITEKSGFYELVKQKLERHEIVKDDEVMVDKGFMISSEIHALGLKLIIPPFASSNSQMPIEHCALTKLIAKHRIHVERAIKRAKEFKILQTPIPMTLLPCINQIFTVCCILSNFRRAIKK